MRFCLESFEIFTFHILSSLITDVHRALLAEFSYLPQIETPAVDRLVATLGERSTWTKPERSFQVWTDALGCRPITREELIFSSMAVISRP